MRNNRSLIAVFVAAMALAPGAALAWQKARPEAGTWDGRWTGSWGGGSPTAVVIRDNRVIAYLYNGAMNPVSVSHVTANEIVYDSTSRDAVVTMTRTGPNNAHAVIKSLMGSGSTDLVRQ
jgi:hypothetical protein